MEFGMEENSLDQVSLVEVLNRACGAEIGWNGMLWVELNAFDVYTYWIANWQVFVLVLRVQGLWV